MHAVLTWLANRSMAADSEVRIKLGIHGATKRLQQIAPCSVQSRDDFYLALQVAWDRMAFYFLRQNRTNFKETPPFLQQRIRVERNSRAESAIESARASTAWSTERVERLIEFYEARSCLYDTKSKEYFNRDNARKLYRRSLTRWTFQVCQI